MIHVLLTTKYASDWISDLSLATKQFIGIKLSSLALSQFVKYMYSSILIRLWLMLLEFSIFL